MTYGAALSLRDVTPGGRRSVGRSSALRTLLIGSAATLAGFSSIIGLVIGAERLLTASLSLQVGIRSAAVSAAPVDPSRRIMASRMPASEQLIAVAAFVAAHEKLPVLTVASADPTQWPKLNDRIQDADDAETATGSIGTPSPTLVSFEPVPVAAPPVIAAVEVRQPLPKARPRFASLAPFKDSIPDEASARTAIYDIAAQTVYLPSGERLEAHSGLGDMMDDPRMVYQKNRGATPPNTYKLTLREALFHGVQAVRMTPDGDSPMYNRDGILAHSYMLGASGQSNGCVSFKDYPKFLAAFMRGEFDRMVVVSRLARAPSILARAGSHKLKQISLLGPPEVR